MTRISLTWIAKDLRLGVPNVAAPKRATATDRVLKLRILVAQDVCVPLVLSSVSCRKGVRLRTAARQGRGEGEKEGDR